MKIIASKLDKLIQNREIKQSKIASDVGVTQTHISKLCKGTTQTTQLTLYKLAIYFNVNPCYFTKENIETPTEFNLESFYKESFVERMMILMAFYNIKYSELVQKIDINRSTLESYLKQRRSFPDSFKNKCKIYLTETHLKQGYLGVNNDKFPISIDVWLN